MHLGARGSVPRSVADPWASHRAKASGTTQVLDAARYVGDPHVVVASSVYGADTELPKRESMVARPVSPYAASKLATESYTLAWQHAYGLPTLALRFFNVFGPMQAVGHAYAPVVPAFVSAALKGRPLPAHGEGTQSRDSTYVGTVCEVLRPAAVDHVVSPDPVGLREVLETTVGCYRDTFGTGVRSASVAAVTLRDRSSHLGISGRALRLHERCTGPRRGVPREQHPRWTRACRISDSRRNILAIDTARSS